MQLLISDHQTRRLVGEVLQKLASKERKRVETGIAAVTSADLVTAVRPFMFGGRVVHELYFDSSKLLFYTKREKVGAVVSAFIISSLALDRHVPFSDQSLRTHAKQIIQHGRRLKYGSEVRAFLRRFKTLEDEWRRDQFSDLPSQADC